MAASNRCKYAYWVDEKKAGQLKVALKKAGHSVIVSDKAVCVPLSRRIDIGIIPPATWEYVDLCKRPLSWYWVSKRAGQYPRRRLSYQICDPLPGSGAIRRAARQQVCRGDNPLVMTIL